MRDSSHSTNCVITKLTLLVGTVSLGQGAIRTTHPPGGGKK